MSFVGSIRSQLSSLPEVAPADAAPLNAWLAGSEPRIDIDSPDLRIARWAVALGERTVVVVPVSRALGTALEREALALLCVQLQRVLRVPNRGPAMLRAVLANALAAGTDDGELIVALDGAGRFGFEDLIAELGPGVRVVVGRREERHVLDPAVVGAVERGDRSPEVLATAHAHLVEARAPLSTLARLTAREWCEAQLAAGGAFRLSWDASCVRRAALDALPSGEAIALAVRALLIEVSALEPLLLERCDLLGDREGLGDADEDVPLAISDASAPPDWQTFLERARSTTVASEEHDASRRVRRALGGASAPRGFAALVDRVQRGDAVTSIVAEVDRLNVRGAALFALVQAAEVGGRSELARALWPRARAWLETRSAKEPVFDLLGFHAHVSHEDAAWLLRKALSALATEPSRPDLLLDSFGHDLLHTLDVIARVGGDAARENTLREVVELSSWLP